MKTYNVTFIKDKKIRSAKVLANSTASVYKALKLMFPKASSIVMTVEYKKAS